jgi:hypothetical protein
MALQFKKATKLESRLRLAFVGPAGSGKTYSALSVATGLGGRIAVIDTERGSASKYADLFEFDVLELESFAPTMFVQAIKAAESAGYDIIIIDSLSHAWIGRDGALEQVDNHARKDRGGNSFAAWRHITPKHNEMVDAIIGARAHVIATMRAKTEWVVEKDKNGKSVPRKIGLAPVQRDGLEFEFDLVGDLDIENCWTVTKTRCPAFTGKLIERPGVQVAEVLKEWLRGAPRPVEEGRKPVPAIASCPSLDELGTPETVARILGVTTARVRQLDDELKPLRTTPDERRFYPAERVDLAPVTADPTEELSLDDLIASCPSLDELGKLRPRITSLPMGSSERKRLGALYNGRRDVLRDESRGAT